MGPWLKGLISRLEPSLVAVILPMVCPYIFVLNPLPYVLINNHKGRLSHTFLEDS